MPASSASAERCSIYQEAVEAAFQLWREGDIPNLTAEELRTLTDGEYWVLSQPVRSSGAGFLLKRKLSEIRRALVAATSSAK